MKATQELHNLGQSLWLDNITRAAHFSYVVVAWLLVIILNLLMIPGYFDIALRDFGLFLGALALTRLSKQFAS